MIMSFAIQETLGLTSLPAESRELALRRFELLRPYLDGLLSLRSVVKDHGFPYRTTACWVAGYRKDGLAALARKGRSDEGARRLTTEWMVQAIEGLALAATPFRPPFRGPSGGGIMVHGIIALHAY